MARMEFQRRRIGFRLEIRIRSHAQALSQGLKSRV